MAKLKDICITSTFSSRITQKVTHLHNKLNSKKISTDLIMKLMKLNISEDITMVMLISLKLLREDIF